MNLVNYCFEVQTDFAEQELLDAFNILQLQQKNQVSTHQFQQNEMKWTTPSFSTFSTATPGTVQVDVEAFIGDSPNKSDDGSDESFFNTKKSSTSTSGLEMDDAVSKAKVTLADDNQILSQLQVFTRQKTTRSPDSIILNGDVEADLFSETTPSLVTVEEAIPASFWSVQKEEIEVPLPYTDESDETAD